MRKLNIWIMGIILAIFTISCDTDGGTSNIDLQEGAVPTFHLNDEYPTILNLNQLSLGNHSDFGFNLDIFYGDVSSADLVGFYRKANGQLMGPVTFQSDLTEFPIDVVMSTTDVIERFPEINGLEDFELGDELLITAKLYLTDGRVLDLMDEDGRLYGSDIHTSAFFDPVANYPVGCPLNGKFTGEYKVEVISDPSGFGTFAESEFTVNFAETSQTQRTFSFSYLPDIGGFNVNATLQFVCETLSLPNTSAGIGCGGGAITFESSQAIEIDPNDDSGFTIEITDFVTDGGCGVGTRSATLTFTKI